MLFILLCIQPTLASANTQNHLYNIFRNGAPIGQYNFVVETNGETKIVHAAMNINVSLGPIPLYTARHKRTEKWLKDTLVSMDGHSVYNGKSYDLKLRQEGLSYLWSVNNEQTIIDQDIITVTPWAPAGWSSGILLTEKGKMRQISREYLGEYVLGEGTETIQTRHYKIIGEKRNRELWYDLSGKLIALKYEKDGAEIYFEHSAPYASVNFQ